MIEKKLEEALQGLLVGKKSLLDIEIPGGIATAHDGHSSADRRHILTAFARLIVAKAKIDGGLNDYATLRGKAINKVDSEGMVNELEEVLRRVEVRCDAKDRIDKIADEALPIFFYSSVSSKEAATAIKRTSLALVREQLYTAVGMDPLSDLIGFGFIDEVLL